MLLEVRTSEKQTVPVCKSNESKRWRFILKAGFGVVVLAVMANVFAVSNASATTATTTYRAVVGYDGQTGCIDEAATSQSNFCYYLPWDGASAYTDVANALTACLLKYSDSNCEGTRPIDWYCCQAGDPFVEFEGNYAFVYEAVGCPNGGTNSATSYPGWCIVNNEPPTKEQYTSTKNRNKGPNCPCEKGDPIEIGMGNVYEKATDYQAHSPFGLSIRRYYNSLVPNFSRSVFGYGWSSDFDRKLHIIPNYVPPTGGSSYTRFEVIEPNGKVYYFKDTGNGIPVPETSKDLGILTETTSGYVFHDPDGLGVDFNSAGLLVSVINRDGLAVTYSFQKNLLVTATGPFGRTLTFSYGSNGLANTVTRSDGVQYSYTYDSYGNLTSVTYPDGRVVTYQYSDSSFPHALTAIINNDGTTRSSWSYDSQGRPTQNVEGGGLRTISVTYNSDGSEDVTDSAGGTTTHYTFNTPSGVYVFGSANQSCANCGKWANATYDSNGNLASRTDFKGNETTYVYDSQDLQTSRTEVAGTSLARTVNTTWNTALREPTDISDGIQDDAYTYDSTGHLTRKVVTDVPAASSRATAYSYDAAGLLNTVTGPRKDVSQVTTYNYNDTTGNLTSITNALGQTTQFTAYDSIGNPTTIVGPNGVTTTLAYDAMQRVSSVDRGGATTGFTYDTNGWLSTLTLPNGATYTYGYDALGRVTSITDAAGNKIVYTRDGYGKITQRQILNVGGAVTETQSRTYNALEKLATVVGSANQTSSYSYDSNGNLTSYTNPDSQTWGYAYDVLNRLSTITRPDSKTVGYTYNSRGDVTQITDPRGLSTDYTYNGFDDLTRVVSPNTATTSYAYDAAGDLTSRTDANGTATTYTYDKLDRLTQVAYSSTLAPGGGTASFGYDQGTDGIGHLTSYANASETSTLGYNALGQVVSQSNTLAGQALNVAYTYDLSGNVTSVTYPDGMKVSYTRDATGRVSGISATIGGSTQTLASNVTWQPFGSLASIDFANGLTFSNGYTQDGWLSSVLLSITSNSHKKPLVSKTLGYDNAGNPTGITDNVTSGNSELFNYDGLNQLNFANGAYGAITYGYDGDGNRTSKANTAGTATYAYPATNNKLQSISGPGAASYTYDADGNVTADGTHTYTYAETGRLIGVDTGINYGYNALGKRVEKQVTTGGQTTTTLFVYDQAGQLIGQYSGSGAMEQEIVWLRNRPIAVVTPSGVYYIQTDQRDAPRTITDSAGTIVWQWNPTPFGENAPTSSSGFVFNLRYPGQYYDAETGNVYNHARYYDPGLGRYLESDPLGLFAGINTYSYVQGNPLNRVDSKGLDVASQDLYDAERTEGPMSPQPSPVFDIGIDVTVIGQQNLLGGSASVGASFNTDGYFCVNYSYSIGPGMGNFAEIGIGGTAGMTRHHQIDNKAENSCGKPRESNKSQSTGFYLEGGDELAASGSINFSRKDGLTFGKGVIGFGSGAAAAIMRTYITSHCWKL